MQDTILKVENVSKFYPGVTALNDVSFTVKKGEVRALVGENPIRELPENTVFIWSVH